MKTIRDMDFGEVGTMKDGRLIICHKDPRLSAPEAKRQGSKCWSIVVPEGICIYFNASKSENAVQSVMLHSETFGEKHNLDINSIVTIHGKLSQWSFKDG